MTTKKSKSKTITVNRTITLVGDSLWKDKCDYYPQELNVIEMVISRHYQDDNTTFCELNVEHDGPWTVYQDSALLRLVNEYFPAAEDYFEGGEQGMQGMRSDNGNSLAWFEGDESDYPGEVR